VPKDHSDFDIYLKALAKNLAHDDATEHTHRLALQTLLQAVGKGITATNEPKRIQSGAPDFNISHKKIPLGHIETKDIGVSLDAIEKDGAKVTPSSHDGKQLKKYLAGLPNLIVTDYLEFRWFVGGQKHLTARIAELQSSGKLHPKPEGELELAQLLDAFFKQQALTIGTAKELANRMAGMTRIIRDLIIKTFELEAEKGWLHNWIAAFREVLIPDLGETQFADMFAQTLAYGLFAARVHAPVNQEFSREMAAYSLPKTNPFLRKLFAEIAGVDMPETINWAVDDIVELLKHADMAAILEDFGKGKGKEDPVVHFYETFLAAYDPKMRKVRGVYYTPEPIVSYIVRSIDHLLKTRFNRPKGLADENTLILDPATGTATFLYFVVNQIYEGFAKQKGAWDGYVDKHLLNRIFGFELLIAPYAIAHLKLGMQLADLGYEFRSDQRLGIYLTNTLEEAAKKADQLFSGWIAEEANAAAAIKRDRPVLVVLGNPPYSGHSANRNRDDNGALTFIGELIEDYKKGCPELHKPAQAKWLQDDYVKFIRFAQWRIERTGEGVIGLITNHAYLDNPTFRGMRRQLMACFSEIRVYDLHGNAKRRERAPDGTEDQNVFDIQQGVAILFCVKEKDNSRIANVFHSDLWGTREAKYKSLAETDASQTEWQELQPTEPQYLFVPQDSGLLSEYERGWSLRDVFSENGDPAPAIVTTHDQFAIAFTREGILSNVRTLVQTDTEEQARKKFKLCRQSQWNYETAKKELAENAWEKQALPILYRPFDTRWTVYNSNVAVHRRERVMRHMLAVDNLAILGPRRVEGSEDWRHILACKVIADHVVVSLKTVDYIFPLYLSASSGDELDLHEARRPNLGAPFLKSLSKNLGLTESGPKGLPQGVTPEDVFRYAYAVCHSPTYRSRYAQFLRTDFPRLPLTSDIKLFRALAEKGAELTALHLMESPKLDDAMTEFPAKGVSVVEKVQYTEKDQRVRINPTQYFGGVPREVWEFHIGGYQVCEKWLKDRKGRNLSYDDIQHYQKIVVALNETIGIMREIDEVIEQHGGWPIK